MILGIKRWANGTEIVALRNARHLWEIFPLFFFISRVEFCNVTVEVDWLRHNGSSRQNSGTSRFMVGQRKHDLRFGKAYHPWWVLEKVNLNQIYSQLLNALQGDTVLMTPYSYWSVSKLPSRMGAVWYSWLTWTVAKCTCEIKCILYLTRTCLPACLPACLPSSLFVSLSLSLSIFLRHLVLDQILTWLPHVKNKIFFSAAVIIFHQTMISKKSGYSFLPRQRNLLN